MELMSGFEKKMSEMLMKNFAQSMMKDLVGEKTSLPNINQVVNKGMSKSFGDSWDMLPITGPRMMALVFILNSVLGTKGVTPKMIAETAIAKAKEFNIDEKSTQLLEKIKMTNTISKDDIKSFASNLGDQAKEQVNELMDVVNNFDLKATMGSVGEAVTDIGEKGLEGAKSIGKSVGGFFRKKSKNGEKDEN